MGYPVLWHPSFPAFKNGHNAVQIWGIFCPNKSPIKAQIRRIFRQKHGDRHPGHFQVNSRRLFWAFFARYSPKMHLVQKGAESGRKTPLICAKNGLRNMPKTPL